MPTQPTIENVVHLGASGPQSLTITLANLLVVQFGNGHSPTPGTPTLVQYNGVNLTPLSGAQGTDGAWDTASTWYMINPPTGTHTVDVTGVDQVAWAAFGVIGANTAAPFRTPTNAVVTNPPGGTTHSITIPSAVGDLVIGNWSTDGSSGTAVFSDHQIWYEQDLAGDTDHGGQWADGQATSTTLTWTIASADQAAMSGAAITPLSGGAIAQVDPPRLANPMRPFKGIIGKVALALRTARPPAAVASAGTPVTFTPSAAVSTWTAPTPMLTAGGVTLSPTAASSTWVAGTLTLTVGALSLAPAAATSSWTVPAPSLSPGALSLTPTAATSSWVAPTPVLSAGGVSLAPSASVSTWVAGAATLTPGALSLTPAAAVSTWTAGTASLGGGSQLTPSAAVSTWVAGTATLAAGALALSPSAPSRAWVSGAPSLTPGGLALAPTAPASTWTVAAPVLAAGALTLSPAAAARAWNAGAPSLSVGAISILSSSAIAVWVVPSPSFFSNTTHHLDEPLSIDFTSLATAIDFTSLGTAIDFDSLETMVVFLDGGRTVFELTILEGEVPTVKMILQGADPVTGVLEPYDVSAASSLKFTAGGKSGAPIMAAKDLTKVNGGADGVVSFTPTSAETAAAGRYDALAVATFPGSPSIVRKFPGKLVIRDAIA